MAPVVGMVKVAAVDGGGGRPWAASDSRRWRAAAGGRREVAQGRAGRVAAVPVYKPMWWSIVASSWISRIRSISSMVTISFRCSTTETSLGRSNG